MSHLKIIPEPIQTKSISEVLPGDVLLNLGEVIEIEEQETNYSLVILRMKEKQVFKFEKEIAMFYSR